MTAAYELFARHGVQAVGIDAIIERSGVARQTLYRHFGSKQELVLAFLAAARGGVDRTAGWPPRSQRREHDPRRRLLAIFDVFDEWFRDPDFEGCSFINVMLEHPAPDHPLHQAAAGYLARIRAFLRELARDAGIADPSGVRAAVAHPDEGLDRGRRRGRPRRRPPSQADGRAAAQLRYRAGQKAEGRDRRAAAGSRRCAEPSRCRTHVVAATMMPRRSSGAVDRRPAATSSPGAPSPCRAAGSPTAPQLAMPRPVIPAPPPSPPSLAATARTPTRSAPVRQWSPGGARLDAGEGRRRVGECRRRMPQRGARRATADHRLSRQLDVDRSKWANARSRPARAPRRPRPDALGAERSTLNDASAVP